MLVPIYLYFKENTSFLDKPVSRKHLFAKGSEKLIRNFLEKPDHEVKLMDYHYVIALNRMDILEIMLKEYGHTSNYPGAPIWSPLIFATEELNRQAVEILVKNGADVNFVDTKGNTALIYAIQEGSYMRSFPNSIIEIVKTLVEAGADVNIKGDWHTPIEAAIYAKEMAIVKYLVENGADINYLSEDDSNYLSACVSIECTEFFLEKGLDINLLNNKGENILPISTYIPSDDISTVKMLIEWGVDICHLDNKGKNILIHAEEGDSTSHLQKDNPEFYKNKLIENRNTEVYKYLELEYKRKCLK